MAIGNIEKRGDNKYRLTVSGGFDSTGKRIKYRKTITAKSEKEASKQLALFISEIERQEFVAPTKLTFSEFTSRWRADYAEHTLADKTLARYECLLRDNILPVIGKLKLEQIKPVHLLELYSSLTKDGSRKDGKEGGYSTKTIKHIHRLIRSMLEKAVLWQIISSNPAARVQPPKVNLVNEAQFYDSDQIGRLFNELASEPIKYQTFIKLAVYTAARRSELIALEWNDIDFDKNLLSIKRATVYVSGKGVVTKNTKTVRSTRTIAISDSIKKILLDYKDWQDKLKEEIGVHWTESGKVFVNDQGVPLHPDTISQWFPKFIRRKQLPPITVHQLRHSGASLLLQAGVDIETISRVLGHNSSSVTSQIYLHSSHIAKIDAAQKLERLLNKDSDKE